MRMGKPGDSLPKNWPPTLTYLTNPHYAVTLTTTQLNALRTKKVDANVQDLIEIPAHLKPGPTLHVKITPISDPRHPANGQAGLFATKLLPHGSLIIPYLGEYHATPPRTAEKSDYDLWLNHEADIAIDAAKMGNEARFINDYRGVPGHTRPNAEFRSVWDKRRGEMGMAVFVLLATKNDKGNSKGIAKGEEILVSYGKGFWNERRVASLDEEGEPSSSV